MDGGYPRSIPFGFPVMSCSGKYVGNRPVKLKKADDTAIRPVEIGHRKAKKLEQDLKKNRRKPY